MDIETALHIEEQKNSNKPKKENNGSLWYAVIVLIIIVIWVFYKYDESMRIEILDAEERGEENGEEIGYEKCYEEMQPQINTLQEEYNNLENVIYDYEEELQTYRDNICFVTSAGECFHTYDCFHINWHGDVYIMTINDAISSGYRSCLDCHYK